MDEDNTAALAEIIKHVKEYEAKLAEKKIAKIKLATLKRILKSF